MQPFLRRNLFRLYLTLRLEILWATYTIAKFKRIILTCQKIDNWNKNFLNFQHRFPFLNSKYFIENYKYWIHWVTKMDIREKLVFNKNHPIVQVNEEDWVHFDLTTNTISIFYLSFDFSINEWVKIELFDNIDLFAEYLYNGENSAESLMSNIQNICREKRMERIKNNKSRLSHQLN